jgi:hypothetical protein
MKISQGYLHNMLILLENIFRVANNLPSRVIEPLQLTQNHLHSQLHIT